MKQTSPKTKSKPKSPTLVEKLASQIARVPNQRRFASVCASSGSRSVNRKGVYSRESAASLREVSQAKRAELFAKK
jgi:hypothetical protein